MKRVIERFARERGSRFGRRIGRAKRRRTVGRSGPAEFCVKRHGTPPADADNRVAVSLAAKSRLARLALYVKFD
jgi:hypothetical protein